MKFEVGEKVALSLGREDLAKEDSKTRKYCGFQSEMLKATDGGEMVVLQRHNGPHHLHGVYRSYRVSHPKFENVDSWWFHEDDLEFYNLTLENE